MKVGFVDEKDFPSNKRPPGGKPMTTPKENLEKVVTGKVVTRRKPLSRRFAETFIAEDSQSVGRYVLMEILIPAAKDLISDVVSQAVDRTLFGGRGGRSRPGYRSGASSGHVSYNRYASQQGGWRREEERPNISNRARRSHDFDEIVLATRAEANEVIDRMFDLVSKYEEATISDLYGLVGLEAKYTDEKWGWRDLRGAGAVRVNGGYLLDLPRPEQLD